MGVTALLYFLMRSRTVLTTAVAAVAVVAAVAISLSLRGGQKEELSENTPTVIENDDGVTSNTAYSRVESYSAFSEIMLSTNSRRIIPYFEAATASSSTKAEPTAGNDDITESQSKQTSSGRPSSSEKTTQREPTQTTSPEVISEISLLRLINATHPLPSNFVPKTAKMDGQYVGRVIYPHLKEMLDDARSEGVYMFIRSGYRSYASQESVLNSFISKYRNRGYSYEEARRLALQTASLPGCSEHQSGLAVDINATGGTSSYTAYAWLAKNAYKYGFILRYPSGKESITGIEYEPWHYRYVGIGEAEKIKDSGLCLEEYLGG